MTVRFNSGGSVTPGHAGRVQQRDLEANAVNDMGSARRPMIYRYNVVTGGGCDATDVTAAPGFVNLAGGVLHLTPSATARGMTKPRFDRPR